MAYAGTEIGIDNNHQQYTKDVLVAPQFGEHSRSGWTFSLGAPIIDNYTIPETYDHSGNPLQQCVVGGDDAHSCCYIDRLRMIMADGSTHEFRSTDQPICFTSSGGVSPTPPDDLYSVDGAKMHYKRSTKTLYLPDGSYWTMSTGSYFDSYFDRNGNLLQSASGDTLGRTLTNPLANTGTEHDFVSGSWWRNARLHLSLAQSFPSANDIADTAGNVRLFLLEEQYWVWRAISFHVRHRLHTGRAHLCGWGPDTFQSGGALSNCFAQQPDVYLHL
jgi:hypothetical protein